MSTRKPLSRKTASQANIPVQSTNQYVVSGVDNPHTTKQKQSIQKPTSQVPDVVGSNDQSSTVVSNVVQPNTIATTETGAVKSAETSHKKLLRPSSLALMKSPANKRPIGFTTLPTVDINEILSNKTNALKYIEFNRKQLNDHMIQNRKLAHQSSQDSAQIRAISRQNKIYENHIQQLQRTIKALQNTATTRTHNTATAIQSDQAVESMQEKVALLELQRDELNTELEQLRHEKTVLTAKYQTELQTSNDQLADLQGKHQLIQDELNHIKSMIQQYTATMHRTTSPEPASTAERITLMLYDIHQLIVRTTELDQQLHDTINARDAENKELIKQLQSELLDERGTVEALEIANGTLMQAYNTANEQAIILSNEIERLQEQLKQYSETVHSIQQRYDDTNLTNLLEQQRELLNTMHDVAVPTLNDSSFNIDQLSLCSDTDSPIFHTTTHQQSISTPTLIQIDHHDVHNTAWSSTGDIDTEQ